MGPISIITKIGTCLVICSNNSRCVNCRCTQNVEQLWYIMGSVMKCSDLTSTNILIITLQSSFHDHRQLPG